MTEALWYEQLADELLPGNATVGNLNGNLDHEYSGVCVVGTVYIPLFSRLECLEERHLGNQLSRVLTLPVYLRCL